MRNTSLVSIIRFKYRKHFPRPNEVPDYFALQRGASFVAVSEAVKDYAARKAAWCVPGTTPPSENYCYRFALILNGRIVDSFDAPEQAYLDAVGSPPEFVAPALSGPRLLKTSQLPNGKPAPYWISLHEHHEAPVIPDSIAGEVWAKMNELAAHFPECMIHRGPTVWGCVTPGLNLWEVQASATRAPLNAAVRAGYCCWEIGQTLEPPAGLDGPLKFPDATPVRTLELPSAVITCLCADGLETVGALRKNLDALLQVPGISTESRRQILAVLGVAL